MLYWHWPCPSSVHAKMVSKIVLNLQAIARHAPSERRLHAIGLKLLIPLCFCLHAGASLWTSLGKLLSLGLVLQASVCQSWLSHSGGGLMWIFSLAVHHHSDSSHNTMQSISGLQPGCKPESQCITGMSRIHHAPLPSFLLAGKSQSCRMPVYSAGPICCTNFFRTDLSCTACPCSLLLKLQPGPISTKSPYGCLLVWSGNT